jgi:hypothetical protein
VSPLVGGALIGALGVVAGVRIGFAATLALAVLTLLVVARMDLPAIPTRAMKLRGVWAAFDPSLRRLLVSDVVIRTCEGLAGVFVILYVTTVRGYSVPAFSVPATVDFDPRLPAGRADGGTGSGEVRDRHVPAFALFPVAVALAVIPAAMALAFVADLREIGEPPEGDDRRLRARRARGGRSFIPSAAFGHPAAAIGGLWRVARHAVLRAE